MIQCVAVYMRQQRPLSLVFVLDFGSAFRILACDTGPDPGYGVTGPPGYGTRYAKLSMAKTDRMAHLSSFPANLPHMLPRKEKIWIKIITYFGS